jgi:DNA mismatch endonuclease (patch repair protein)
MPPSNTETWTWSHSARLNALISGMIEIVPGVPPSSPHATATMRANRGHDTTPEIALRSALHAHGLRFRKNVRIDVGDRRRARPDIVFSRLRLAIFVDGCFWHGCREHRSLPVSNAAFWKQKIEATARRDSQQAAWLHAAGWSVIRVWEHDVPERALQVILDRVDELRAEPHGNS